MTQSSKSTQGSEPSPQLECDENVELVPSIDLLDSFSDLDLSSDLGSGAVVCDYAEDSVDQSGTFASHLPYIYSLLEKEVEYACNPFSLQLLQPHITPMMRAVLLDWMMEVCGEFTLKRETYYLACNYIDRVLSLKSGVKREEFQLLGLAAMVLAAKVEEICTPKLSDFVRSADSGFSLSQLKVMEKSLLKTLSWKVLPPTVYSWITLCMTLWDEYVLSLLVVSSAPDSHLVLFKQSSQPSYARFRETMQVLDAAYLDADVLRYSPRNLAAGLLYLMVSKYCYETDYAMLTYAGAENWGLEDSLSVCFGNGIASEEPERAHVVQQLFGEFAAKAMEIRSVEDIYPTVSFLSAYMDFDAAFDLPIATRLLPRSKLESHYEDFLAFQTHNDTKMKPVAASGKVAQKPCPAVLIWCQTEEAPRRVVGFAAAHRERYAEKWGNSLRSIDAKEPVIDAETCDKRTPNVWNIATLWSKGTKTAYEGLRDS